MNTLILAIFRSILSASIIRLRSRLVEMKMSCHVIFACKVKVFKFKVNQSKMINVYFTFTKGTLKVLLSMK